MRLMKVSQKERDAAFAKIYPELLMLAERYTSMMHVPFVDVRSMVITEMSKPEFKLQVLQVLDDALEAAEKARAEDLPPEHKSIPPQFGPA